MKILHVITSLLPGGAERLMTDILPEFKNKGIDVELAVFNAIPTTFMDKLKTDGIALHRFFPKGCNPYSPLNYFKLIKLLSENNYDIVHTHNTAAQFYVALLPHLKSTKFITTEHNTYNRRRDYKAARLLDKWMYHRYNHVICISEGTHQELIRHIKNLDRVNVIDNGIKIKNFLAEIKPIESKNAITLTQVAGFRPQKDQDTVIRALKLLPTNYRLILVGDGERKKALTQLVEDLNLSDRVKFAGFQSDVTRFLKNSDIIIVSSNWEGFGLSAVEAMAAGKPVIASDVSGLREIVHGYGYLFPRGDEQKLAEIILSLTNDEKLYLATAKNCQDRALNYDISVMINRYVSLYKSILNQQSINA